MGYVIRYQQGAWHVWQGDEDMYHVTCFSASTVELQDVIDWCGRIPVRIVPCAAASPMTDYDR